MFHHLLVPIDGSTLSDSLVTKAIEAAGATKAKLTFFHAAEDIAATSDGALAHAAWPSSYESLAHAHALTILAKAEAAARAAGIPCEVKTCLSQRPHEAMHDAALEAGCDAIFIAARRAGMFGRVLHKSVTRKLLEVSTLPVVVVSATTRVQSSDEEAASAILRNEHRSLAAVLNAMRDVLALAGAGGQAIDHRLMRAMLYYIEFFPERLHHPKEEIYLFARLRARAPQFSELLDRLEQEHKQGSQDLLELRQALDDMVRTPVGDVSRFAPLAQRYIESQFSHMALEEGPVKNAARAHLTAEDWRDIRHALADNADPRFGADADEPFEHLLERLIGLAYGPSNPAVPPPATPHNRQS